MLPETKPKITILDEPSATNSPILRGISAGLIGLILGLIFAGGTFLQTGYIDDSFSNLLLAVTLPLGFFIFYALKFKYAFIYPVFLLFSGENFSETDSFEWLGAVLSTNPSNPQADLGARFATAVMIAIIWMVLALFIEGIAKAIALSKFNKRRMIIYIFVAFIPVVLLIGFLNIGEKLQADRKIASNSYSKPQIEGVEIKSVSDQANEVTYKDKDGRAITIKGSGGVPYPKVEDFYVDTHNKSVFGENACVTAQPVGSIQTKNYEVRKIQGGDFEYGYAEFELNRSNPPSPENAYNSFLYCFVINGDRYVLQRDDFGTDAHLKLYPAEDIIKSILSSKQELK